MKQRERLLSLAILITLFLFQYMSSENFVTLDRFWWLLGFYAILIICFNILQLEFRRGLIVTGVILLILFSNLPLPFNWLITHKVYFSLALIATALTIFGYTALVIFLAERITQTVQTKRLHT